MVKVKTTRHRKPAHPHRHTHRQPFLNNGVSHVALGAAAGCMLGAAAALFLVPKPKRHKLTQGLDALYDQFTGTAEDYAHDVLEKGQKAYKAAKDSAGDICATASQFFSNAGKNSNRNLILGIIGAGLLGASAVYAISQKTSHGRESFADRWGTAKWSEMAKYVIDTVSDKLQGSDESSESHHPIANIVDWASMGLNLWQEIKKRR